jgi:hypothetical protein
MPLLLTLPSLHFLGEGPALPGLRGVASAVQVPLAIPSSSTSATSISLPTLAGELGLCAGEREGEHGTKGEGEPLCLVLMVGPLVIPRPPGRVLPTLLMLVGDPAAGTNMPQLLRRRIPLGKPEAVGDGDLLPCLLPRPCNRNFAVSSLWRVLRASMPVRGNACHYFFHYYITIIC